MDDGDRAQVREEFERDAAIKAASLRPKLSQLTIDGAVVCRRCYDSIPRERLKAVPLAVHCIECQSIEERVR